MPAVQVLSRTRAVAAVTVIFTLALLGCGDDTMGTTSSGGSAVGGGGAAASGGMGGATGGMGGAIGGMGGVTGGMGGATGGAGGMANTAPAASVADAAKLGLSGDAIRLEGSATDADGDALTYAWAQTAGPAGAVLHDADAATAFFVPDRVGAYTFELTANDGTEDSAPAAVTVTVHAVDGGINFGVALKSDGTLLTWGRNGEGQLGYGDTEGRAWPWQPCTAAGLDCGAPPFDDLVAVSTGLRHTLLLTGDGSVWAMGANGNGQLGTGNNAPSSVPVQVCDVGGCGAMLGDVVAIAAGGRFSLALESDGTVVGWGVNRAGELGQGDGSASSSNVPVAVCETGSAGVCSTVLDDVIQITAGGDEDSEGGGGQAMALTSSGTLYAWGDNSSGQVGIDSADAEVHLPTPVCVPNGASCDPLVDVVAMDAWSGTSFALAKSGKLLGFGDNAFGQLGHPTSTVCAATASCSRHPVPVCTDATCTTELSDVASFEVGLFFTLAVKTDGSVHSWGANFYGQLARSESAEEPYPGPVCAAGTTVPCGTFLTDVAAVAAGNDIAFALTEQGELFGWGVNSFRETGIGLGEPTGNRLAVPTHQPAFATPSAPPNEGGPCAVQGYSARGASVSFMSLEGCLNIADGAYDGTLASMTCMHLSTGTDEARGGVDVSLRLTHPAVGELVIKLLHPSGAVVPILSRPGLSEGIDDGSGTGGAIGGQDDTGTWRIDAYNGTDAEQMGMAAGIICPTGTCEFTENRDAALPAATLGSLDGLNVMGDWAVCVGDAEAGNLGAIHYARIDHTGG